ncbi:lycopene cyclase domain-containing protein [Saccharomonospora sp.]|uniref:lycopene cyclase domain-containing protein n=1 Tax=Saccharomonospora sp. TaxID=33913 RepID=UPI0026215545|nr:lycopene cyclase domain-containing protein [Saccharomonospora sp.]
MERWQYLLVLAACLLVTLPLEFLGAWVYRRPVQAARAILPAAGVFLVWDVLATVAGVWDFDRRYLVGVELPFGLPLEELLFFLVIPLCALLTYGCVEAMLAKLRVNRANR